MVNKFIHSILLRASIPVFGVINFMIIVRIFEEEEVGVWVLYMTIMALIEVIKTGFLKSATIWSLNKDDQDHSKLILSSSLGLNILLTLAFIVLILIVIVILQWGGTYILLSRLLLFYCIQLLIHIPFSHLEYYHTSQLGFRNLMFAYIIRNFSFFIFLGSIYFFSMPHEKLEYLVLYQSVGIIFGAIFLNRFCDYKIDLKIYSRKYWKQIMNYGKYVFATNASSTLFRSTDHYMLAGLINSTAVAYYNVALRITNLMDLPSTAVAEVLFPMSIKTSDRKDLKAIYEKAVGYILAFAVPSSLAVFLLAKPIVIFIAGSDYLASVGILQITLIYGLILPFLKQFGTVIDALNYPKINFYLMFGTFIVNIVFNYLCINKFGLMGAAYGTLISYFFTLCASQLILKKFLNIEFFKIWVNMFKAYLELYNRISRPTSKTS